MDPIIEVRPVKGQVDDLLGEMFTRGRRGWGGPVPGADQEAEVELTVSPEDSAARLGIDPGEVYPEVVATRTMIG